MNARLPTLNPREMIAALKRAGFVEQHQKGSHLYLWRAHDERITSVPVHPGTLGRGLVRQILSQVGLSEEEFRKLL